MQLPPHFDPIIATSLLPGENIEDIRRAAEIIIEERLRYSSRPEATFADVHVALMALCFPIPGGPPKKPKYEEEIRRIRKDKIADIPKNPEKEKRFRESLQVELLGITREGFYYPDIVKFFRFERVAEA